jgi:rubrerythrin
MTTIDMPSTTQMPQQQLGLILQYTIEAYKQFQKFAENLPNPMAAATFEKLAGDEREHRDLIDLKYRSSGTARIRVTIGGDLGFQEMLEGDLSYREMTEFLIGRERTMERKLLEFSRSASPSDKPLLVYLAAGKRTHVVYLERELELIKIYPDWYKREDAESLVVHGSPAV